MLNKPGTLLIVRKRIKDSELLKYSTPRELTFSPGRSGIWNVFRIDPERFPQSDLNESTNQRYYYPYEYVYLPYGAHVLLLSLMPKPVPFGKNNREMKLLYGTKFLVGELSENQCNRWFTFVNTWEKHYKAEFEEMKAKLSAAGAVQDPDAF